MGRESEVVRSKILQNGVVLMILLIPIAENGAEEEAEVSQTDEQLGKGMESVGARFGLGRIRSVNLDQLGKRRGSV